MSTESKYITSSENLKVLTSKAPDKAKEIKQQKKDKHVQGELDTYVHESKDYRYNFGVMPDFWR